MGQQRVLMAARWCWACAALALLAGAAGEVLPAALDAGDECAAGAAGESCALQALQKRVSLAANSGVRKAANWFSRLFGFDESTGSLAAWQATRNQFDWQPSGPSGPVLKSRASGRTFAPGRFETPSLKELRDRTDLGRAGEMLPGGLHTSQVVGDVSELIADPENEFALFQAASQFNCLEFVSDYVTPLDGITGYAYDHTQGPACATSCGAGTVVRNYFALGGDGQTAREQVNNLRSIERFLNNSREKYLRVVNGYTQSTDRDLTRLTKLLSADPGLSDAIRERLHVGLQQDTQVTGSHFGARLYSGKPLLVSQAYCSAASVSYSGCASESWQAFAELVLEAAYEATLYLGVENALRHPDTPGHKKVFLTSLGGGAFGNDIEWILRAMKRAFNKFRHVGLDVMIVSYGHRAKAFCAVGAC